jgi:hypothetical protein
MPGPGGSSAGVHLFCFVGVYRGFVTGDDAFADTPMELWVMINELSS